VFARGVGGVLMGERIRAARWLLHELRHAKQPRYSFEHAAANILFGFVCVILALLGEHRLGLLFISVLMISIGVQGFRAWRFMHRQNREREEWLRRRMREDGDG
jgi:hypothetical protein